MGSHLQIQTGQTETTPGRPQTRPAHLPVSSSQQIATRSYDSTWPEWSNQPTDHMTLKEGNALFNNPLNTFYLQVIWCQTYGKGPLR